MMESEDKLFDLSRWRSLVTSLRAVLVAWSGWKAARDEFKREQKEEMEVAIVYNFWSFY